ncbi:MAG TPA: hypothetical protein VMV73_04630 [Candidatus Dormibacteraeota bacterium]|nr:hypothetical protein [Candidatus Dormibacteraeota bacterium]
MKLAIIGDPVDHSRSPALHRGYLREAEIDGTYDAIQVPTGNAINVVRRMRMDGYTGANVTTPLKEEVLAACDILSDEALRAHAVNTIYFDMQIRGTNTDGIGWRVALEAMLEDSIALRRIGVLGTGATARAILAQCQEYDAHAYVWGRNEERLATCIVEYDASAWPESCPEIVVSTLPPDAPLPHDLAIALAQPEIVMDLNYGKRATLARRLERDVVTGEAMLEAQARASFDFWLAHLDRVSSDD